MLLLSLPPELLHHILSFLDWSSIVSVLCTTHLILDNLIRKQDKTRLRHTCRTHLLCWETTQRGARAWPLELNPLKLAWCEQPGPHLSLAPATLETLPCYVCLRELPRSSFTHGMQSGGRALGQRDARDRVCKACGVRTGIYARGARFAPRCAVCKTCGHLMCPRKGWWRREEDLREIRPRVRNRDVDRELLFGDSAMMASVRGGFYWWDYSNMCFDCTVLAGWTAEDLFAKRVRVQQRRDCYARIMVSSLRRRRDQGRAVRARLGIEEPVVPLPDIQGLSIARDPFPKYRPTIPRWQLAVPKLEYSEPDDRRG